MPPQRRSQMAIIREQMPNILKWVDDGYTLASIHRFLKENGTISCGQSNFKRSYYKFKNSGEKFLMIDNSSATQLSAYKSVATVEAEPVEEQLAPTTEVSPISEGFDFEEQQRIAATAFGEKKELW